MGNVKKPRPPIFSQPLLLQDVPNRAELMPVDVAYRITAIREAFEETGILLLNVAPNDSRYKTSAYSETDEAKIDIKTWMKKVHDNADLFPDFCLEVGLVPDIWALSEWWNWMTPETLGHKRFDTIFYICCLDTVPKAMSDEKEVSAVEWYSPLHTLELHTQNEAFLAPPQVYELSRLCNFNRFEAVRDFARKRQKHGIERWCANITGLKDGAILALPGDDYFDKQITTKSLPSLDEVRMRSTNLNRLELRAPIFKAVSTIKLPCGHVTPVSYPHESSVVLTSNL
jgi:nucleoside diphosphate-linked moiety X motif protein 19